MSKNLDFKELKDNIRLRKFRPVYLFHGEESYFIDQLTDLLITSVLLKESEKNFNQTIMYGSETDILTIINICRRYPMMAEHQLVVVKEAQNLRNIDELVHYVKNPMPSTVLVINYKYGKLDRRKKLTGEIAKTGIIFESKKIYENNIPDFILAYMSEKQITMDFAAARMLANYLGNNLSRISNELNKLSIALPSCQKQISINMIEENISINKEFNNYELQKAVATCNILKANRIAIFFEKNQKNNPLRLTLTVLFNFFSNLMICQFERDQSKGHLMQLLGFKWEIQIIDYMEAIQRYKPRKTMENISIIREYDARGKGFQNASVPAGKLLIELLYKLMHSYHPNKG